MRPSRARARARARLRLVAILGLAACGASDPSPIATITAATPDQLVADDDARDDLTITVAYDDADGDLGTGVAEVHDCRADGVVTMLAIPAIAPSGVAGDDRITGTLDLHVNDVGVVAPASLPAACADLGVTAPAAGEAVFCVVLIDAAGHAGAGDCTQTIAVE